VSLHVAPFPIKPVLIPVLRIQLLGEDVDLVFHPYVLEPAECRPPAHHDWPAALTGIAVGVETGTKIAYVRAVRGGLHHQNVPTCRTLGCNHERPALAGSRRMKRSGQHELFGFRYFTGIESQETHLCE